MLIIKHLQLKPVEVLPRSTACNDAVTYHPKTLSAGLLKRQAQLLAGSTAKSSLTNKHDLN